MYEVTIAVPTFPEPAPSVAEAAIATLRADLKAGRVILPEGSFVQARDGTSQRSLLVDREEQHRPTATTATLPADAEATLRNVLRAIDPILYYHRRRLELADQTALQELRADVERTLLTYLPAAEVPAVQCPAVYTQAACQCILPADHEGTHLTPALGGHTYRFSYGGTAFEVAP